MSERDSMGGDVSMYLPRFIRPWKLPYSAAALEESDDVLRTALDRYRAESAAESREPIERLRFAVTVVQQLIAAYSWRCTLDTETDLERRFAASELSSQVREGIAEFCRLIDSLAGVDGLLSTEDDASLRRWIAMMVPDSRWYATLHAFRREPMNGG